MANIGFRNMVTNEAVAADLHSDAIPRVGDTVKVEDHGVADQPVKYYMVEQVLFIVSNHPSVPKVSTLDKVEVLLLPKE